MEIGAYTFADVGPGITPEERLRNLLEEIELADQVGLDVFGVGEHHRPDFAVSAPAVVLAAAAARTERIRLTSAVTVLSSDDPVRVFQEFATLDLLSGGRAEIMAGRGSFIESFPLFGYDLDDYDELFAEKLELLLQLREQERVTWSGRHRAPLDDLRRLPAAAAGPAAGLDRRRRHAAVGRPGRDARPAAGDRDHRRRAGALRAARRALPRGGARARATTRPRCRSASTRTPTSPRPRERAADEFFPRLRGDDEPDRARARLAADDARAVRRAALAARRAARRQSRRRWPRRSSSSTSCSATTASSPR